ncbi:MAG: 50S ribosomal protein L18 [Alphaproteobacteria bacterium]|nr:50S ribosomal protein L18 [Alphaproteobacteria bacterium]
MSHIQHSRIRRKLRVRTQIRNKSAGRLRLTVFRSNKHIYVQIVDDVKGVTMVSASTIEAETKKNIKKTSSVDAAKTVGNLIAKKAVSAGIKEVVFDRGSYLYHGRIKALADAAREGGLSF